MTDGKKWIEHARKIAYGSWPISDEVIANYMREHPEVKDPLTAARGVRNLFRVLLEVAAVASAEPEVLDFFRLAYERDHPPKK